MSNCLMIHSTAAMALSAIDSDALFRDIDTVNAMHNDAPKKGLNEQIIWWFLSRDNVYIVDDHLHINFGDHRSTHTWRDMRQTVHVLSQYMHDTHQSIMLTQSDESDGFDRTYQCEHHFDEMSAVR